MIKSAYQVPGSEKAEHTYSKLTKVKYKNFREGKEIQNFQTQKKS